MKFKLKLLNRKKHRLIGVYSCGVRVFEDSECTSSLQSLGS